MSIAIMTEVWKDAPVSGTELLMLLALADSANDDRECWPSVRHLCKKTRLSDPQVRKLLKSLVERKLISKAIQGGKGAKGRESNLYTIRAMTPIADDKGGKGSTPITDDSRTPIADDNLNHNSESSIKDSPAEAGDSNSEPAKPKTERPRNPMYDAIKDVWGYTAARNGQMAALLNGTSTKKGYCEYNLDQPVTPEELRAWAAWYRKTALGGDEKLNMVEELIKVQSSITRWQELTADGGAAEDDPFAKMFETAEVIGGKPWEAQS